MAEQYAQDQLDKGLIKVPSRTVLGRLLLTDRALAMLYGGLGAESIVAFDILCM